LRSVPLFALELADFSVFIDVGEGERLRGQQFSHRFDNCEEDPHEGRSDDLFGSDFRDPCGCRSPMG
jgi:hypothetical protein